MTLTADHVLSGPDFGIEQEPLAFHVDGERLKLVAAAAPVANRLAMPALVNAHDHGYGIPTLAVGAPDDALECWIPGLVNRPATDPGLEARIAFGRMALSGIGTTVHCHNSGRRDRILAEAEAVAEAANAVGIRVAFSCPIADRNLVVYGDPAPLANYGHPAGGSHGSATRRSGGEDIDNAVAIAGAHGSDLFNVQLGPIGPQWCEAETLERIAQVSAETGMRVHMHLLETERQRQWLDREWPEGPLVRLDRMGLLSPRLTVAHGVWLQPDECELLAERGVTVAVNSSSNLRLRSGIAPVPRFAEAGLRFAIGLDGAGFDDDQDMFRELRLFRRLQSGMALSDRMPPARVMRAALADAFHVFDGSGDYGRIATGERADLLIVDLAAMTMDVVHDGSPLIEIVLARARARDVRELMVAGRPVVSEGRLCGFDFDRARAELIAQARASPSDRSDTESQGRRREAIRRYYADEIHIK